MGMFRGMQCPRMEKESDVGFYLGGYSVLYAHVPSQRLAVSYHFISYHFISAEQYVYAQGHALVRLHANASAQCV